MEERENNLQRSLGQEIDPDHRMDEPLKNTFAQCDRTQ